jgi:tetratricopeptide (TPR) repeat protein
MAKASPKARHTHHSAVQALNPLLLSFRAQAIILVIIGFLLFGNTLRNEYALDDGIVIEKNDYVQKGLKGIKKIFSTDAYESFYRQMNASQQLSGGRYRPLSIVTFAIEEQFFGSKEGPDPAILMLVRHLVNVLLYILSAVALLYLLQNFIFRENHLVAFLTCVIFLAHPLHTEVIANVKSRDEIMSFLFIIFTFIKLMKYHESRLTKDLMLGLLYYFLALLSKEYAVTLVVLIPMLLYIKKGFSLPESLKATIPFFAVAVLYVFIRLSIVGLGSTDPNPDVLNNPFKYASPGEKWATQIEILNHYLKLLFIPYPLSSDYSFQTIPYTSFADPKVWIAILLHLGMLVATLTLFIRRNIIAFGLAFYLGHLLMVSNLVMDIGATMGERLLYHSSFGFAMILSIGIVWLLKHLEDRKRQIVVYSVAGIIVLLYSFIVIPRNAEWKNDSTLFIADVNTVPNSALVNGNAGKAYIDLSEKPENKAEEKELLLKSIPLLERSVKIHPQYVNGYLNLGVAYFKLRDYQKAESYWRTAEKIYPNNPFLKINFNLLGQVYFQEAMKAGPANPKEAIRILEKATAVDPANAELWYNLGGASFTVGDFAKARDAWEKTLMIQPGHPQAMNGLAAIPAGR